MTPEQMAEELRAAGWKQASAVYWWRSAPLMCWPLHQAWKIMKSTQQQSRETTTPRTGREETNR